MNYKLVVDWLRKQCFRVMLVLPVVFSTQAQVPEYFTDTIDQEYRDVLDHLTTLIPPGSSPDENPLAFSAFLTPYSLLDVQPTKLTSAGHRPKFANFNFGVISAMHINDPAFVKNLAALALCGDDDCHQDRAEQVRTFISEARDALMALSENQKFTIVQQSGQDLFRINNTYFAGPRVIIYEPSQAAGFVPSANMKTYENANEVPDALTQLQVESQQLRLLMATHRIAAVERLSNGHLNIIANGFADNQYGAVWHSSGVSLPEPGDKNNVGFEYQEILPLNAEAYYYQTN